MFKKEQWDYGEVKTFFQFNDIQKKKSLTGENKKLVCITGSLSAIFFNFGDVTIQSRIMTF